MLDPVTDTLYVVNVLGNTVSVVDAATCNGSVTTGCPTAASPPVGMASSTA